MHIGRFGNDLLKVNVQYTSRTTKTLVPAAKVHGADTILTQHGSAHDARLDSDIEIGLIEDLDRVLRQDTSNGNKFRVPGAVKGAVRLVHASTDNLAVLYEDTTDRCLIALECKLSL